MSSGTKFWLGFFTFLPIILLILFFGFFFTVFLENIIELENNHSGDFPAEFFPYIFWLILMIIIMAIVSLGIKIYYIVHTNNNVENDTNKKVLWTLILIFAGSVASIIYYFIEITPLKTLKKN
jgi:hypothetical protein